MQRAAFSREVCKSWSQLRCWWVLHRRHKAGHQVLYISGTGSIVPTGTDQVEVGSTLLQVGARLGRSDTSKFAAPRSQLSPYRQLLCVAGAGERTLVAALSVSGKAVTQARQGAGRVKPNTSTQQGVQGSKVS